MSNVIEFPNANSGVEAASMLAAFTDRACAGAFKGAIVVGIAHDGPEFQMSIGDATTAELLASLGALDVIRARLVRVIEADQDREED